MSGRTYAERLAAYDPDTRAWIEEFVQSAPPLSEAQRDVIRRAFASTTPKTSGRTAA